MAIEARYRTERSLPQLELARQPLETLEYEFIRFVVQAYAGALVLAPGKDGRRAEILYTCLCPRHPYNKRPLDEQAPFMSELSRV